MLTVTTPGIATVTVLLSGDGLPAASYALTAYEYEVEGLTLLSAYAGDVTLPIRKPFLYTLNPAVVPPPEVHDKFTCVEVLVAVRLTGAGGPEGDPVIPPPDTAAWANSADTPRIPVLTTWPAASR